MKSSRKDLQKFAATQTRRVLKAFGAEDFRVDVDLMDDTAIRALNRRFRGINRPTDVLSFESHAVFRANGFLGSLAISVPTAQRQALSLSHSLKDELTVLIVHGIAHLFGHDHEASKKKATEMAALETQVLAALKRRTLGLIRRSTARSKPR